MGGSTMTWRSAGRNFHWAASTILILGLVPVFHHVGLKPQFAWSDNLEAFWIGLGGLAILLSLFLYALQFPKEIGSITRKFMTMHAADQSIARMLKAVILGASYLFVGLTLVSAYNDAIVSVRFFGKYDPLALRVDSWLLGGSSVSGISHWAVQHVPLFVFTLADHIYFAMFTLVGACFVLLAAKKGTTTALRYIGTLLTAYYFALLIFFIMPIEGPFFTCPDHFAVFPKTLTVYGVQKSSLAILGQLSRHAPIGRIGFDYWIGFPSLHIAEPIIALWYLRKWKRIATLLVVFEIFLAPSILLLEQHYLVDLLGGIIMAVVAILIVDGVPQWRLSESHPRNLDIGQLDAVPTSYTS
jgi:hypothetical protein